MSGGMEWARDNIESEESKAQKKNYDDRAELLCKEFMKLSNFEKDQLLNYYKYRTLIAQKEQELKALKSKVGELLYA